MADAKRQADANRKRFGNVLAPPSLPPRFSKLRGVARIQGRQRQRRVVVRVARTMLGHQRTKPVHVRFRILALARLGLVVDQADIGQVHVDVSANHGADAQLDVAAADAVRLVETRRSPRSGRARPARQAPVTAATLRGTVGETKRCPVGLGVHAAVDVGRQAAEAGHDARVLNPAVRVEQQQRADDARHRPGRPTSASRASQCSCVGSVSLLRKT